MLEDYIGKMDPIGYDDEDPVSLPTVIDVETSLNYIRMKHHKAQAEESDEEQPTPENEEPVNEE
jgi:hypothetical protein